MFKVYILYTHSCPAVYNNLNVVAALVQHYSDIHANESIMNFWYLFRCLSFLTVRLLIQDYDFI